MASSPTRKVCLFGASPSTSNLGVSALFHSTVAQLLDRVPELDVTVFDHGDGERAVPFTWSGGTRPLRRMGAHHTRRFWRADSLGMMRLAGRLGGMGNPGWRRIEEAGLVLDISGGDSFTDLYGEKRFAGILLPKVITAEADTPLVLLPQTYGPFRDPRRRALARHAAASAQTAWARDPWSLEALRELLGDEFDPTRHLHGVDVAFGLEPRVPEEPLCPTVDKWLSDGAGPVVGVNISGLVYLVGANAARDYDFVADYQAAMRGLVEGLLAESDVRVVLVPHVLAPAGRPESDPEASHLVLEALPSSVRDRVAVLDPPYRSRDVKHLIARLDWFCGTRMHATIAALSSGVPAGAVAYSPKFQGVFETCDQSAGIADPTILGTDDLVAHLLQSYRDRGEARERLARALPRVRATLGEQFDRIVSSFRPPFAQSDAA